MDPIHRRRFDDPEQQRVQEAAIESATRQTKRHLDAYVRNPSTFGGRFVNADLFKETFQEYAASPEARNHFNAAVHNSAAVLAAEQLRRVLGNPEPGAQAVTFVTGIPGAGKTSAVIASGNFPAGHAAIYEGQLARLDTAIDKIGQVIDAGLRPQILVVHTTPEIALGRTLQRYERTGRGATITLMAEIQGELPYTLAAAREYFGDKVSLQILDARQSDQPARMLHGWYHVQTLTSEGNREEILDRLRSELELRRQSGALAVAAFRQANGDPPLRAGPDRLGTGEPSDHRTTSIGTGRIEEARLEAFVQRPPRDALKVFPELAGSFRAIDLVANGARKENLTLQGVHAAVAVAQKRLHADLERGRTHTISESAERRFGSSAAASPADRTPTPEPDRGPVRTRTLGRER